MTVCRRCKVSAPCSSHYVTVVGDQKNLRGVSVCKRSRSTKGASKARRDQINSEIRSMRALLPINQEEQERLSYLHSMAAICAYIRKTVLFQGFPDGQPSDCSLPYQAFLQALHGFILVTTARGKLVYVSENVADYLGLSMVDVLQGDSMYDMVELSDIDTIKSNFEFGSNASTERSFVCCMHTSKAFRLQHGSCCSMLVRGSFHPSASSAAHLTEESLFVALCMPTVNRLQRTDSSHSFDSVHNPDMTFTQISDSALCLLGYSVEEMSGRSWYSLLHPEDLSLSASSHKSLIQADEGSQVEMVLRLQHKDLSWIWVYIQATKVSDSQRISCANFTISETEARFLTRKIDSNAFTPASQAHSSPSPVQHVAPAEGSELAKGSKRQRTSSSHDEEPGAKIKRLSDSDMYYVSYTSSEDDGTMGHNPALFTPPYSPASSSSPLHNEESGSNFLMDGFSYADQVPSSPEDSLSYYPQPEAGCPPHPSPSESLRAAAEQSFNHEAVHVTRAHSPGSCPSPTFNFQACAANARVVPDSLTGSDACDSPVDCALHPEEFSHLVRPQEGSFFQPHNIPHHAFPLPSGLLTPNPSPTSQGSFPFDDLEQVEISILAQQISSLASSFDRYRALSPVHRTPRPAAENRPSACDWPERPLALSAVPYLKPELVLDDGVFDRILKELDVVTGKSDVHCPGVVTSSYLQQGSASGQNLTQRVGQEPSGRLSSTSANPINGEEFIPANIAMAPFILQLGSRDRNTGLYQLNHYGHRSLQQDGLVEGTLY